MNRSKSAIRLLFMTYIATSVFFFTLFLGAVVFFLLFSLLLSFSLRDQPLAVMKKTSFLFVSNISEKLFEDIRKTSPRVTGYDLFNALNAYRRANNLPEIILHDAVCNNIAERSNVFEETFSHAGLTEHAKAYIYPLVTTPKISSVVELLVSGVSADQMIANLSTSPSHNLALQDASLLYGCTYARRGRSEQNKNTVFGVILLAK